MTPHLTDPMAPYPDEIYKAQQLLGDAYERGYQAGRRRERLVILCIAAAINVAAVLFFHFAALPQHTSPTPRSRPSAGLCGSMRGHDDRPDDH
jgi:hypothetical protein